MDEEERLHRDLAVHDAERGELGVARDEAELKRAHDRGTVGVVGRERLAGALGAGEKIGADLDDAVGGRSSGERAGPKGGQPTTGRIYSSGETRRPTSSRRLCAWVDRRRPKL